MTLEATRAPAIFSSKVNFQSRNCRNRLTLGSKLSKEKVPQEWAPTGSGFHSCWSPAGKKAPSLSEEGL